jgi:lysozyme-related protein Hpa2
LVRNVSPAKGLLCHFACHVKPALLGIAMLAASHAMAVDCIDDAAQHFGTHADVLRAIAIVESRAKPHATRSNLNGSTDRGLFQINSIHLTELKRAGVVPEDLHDVCMASNVASMLLKRKMQRYGNTWAAIGAFHSTVPVKRDRYAAKVRTVFEGIRQIRVAQLDAGQKRTALD